MSLRLVRALSLLVCIHVLALAHRIEAPLSVERTGPHLEGFYATPMTTTTAWRERDLASHRAPPLSHGEVRVTIAAHPGELMMMTATHSFAHSPFDEMIDAVAQADDRQTSAPSSSLALSPFAHPHELAHSSRVFASAAVRSRGSFGSAGGGPRRVVGARSQASLFFPPTDPFNKHGLLRLRGVGYQPTPVGITPLASDAPDLYSASFHHLHVRDLRLLRALRANAIRLWSFGGENERGEAVDHLAFLNLCWRHGLFVILTFNPSQGYPAGTFSVPAEPPRTGGTQEARTSEWSKLCERWRRFVRRYQNHPAVLMWLVGNEPNLSHGAGAGGGGATTSTVGALPAYFKMMTRFAAIRDEECARSRFNQSYVVGETRDDEWTAQQQHGGGGAEFPAASSPPSSTSTSTFSTASPYTPHPSAGNRTFSCWHPLSVPLSDSGIANTADLLSLLLPLEARWPSAVDIWSFQVYRGNTFGNFFGQYATFQSKARTRKPLLITEYGSDAMDFRMDARGEAAVNQSMQAHSVLSQWRELDQCPPSVCVGGVVFEYLDEWWKSSQYPSPAYMGCPLNQTESSRIHAACGWAGRTDDEFYSEAYFGLVAHPPATSETDDHTDHNQRDKHDMACVEPREAFFQLLDAWTSSNASTTATATAVMHTTRRNSSASRASGGWTLPEMDVDQRRSDFCARQACCAYRDSSDWISFLAFVTAVCTVVALYWTTMVCAARRRRREVLVATHSKKQQQLDESKSSVVSVKSASDAFLASDALRADLRAMLLPIFARAADLLRRTVYADTTSSALSAHLSLQVEQLLDAILAQLPRRDSLPQAYVVTHEKMLAGYRSWCTFVGVRPNLLRSSEDGGVRSSHHAYRAQDLAEYLLVWSACEHLRRVPSFVYERFHYRYESRGGGVGTTKGVSPSADSSFDITTLSHRLSPAFMRAAVPMTQVAIDSYQLDYDDLEDVCLRASLSSAGTTSESSGSWRLVFSRWWSSVRAPFSYPASVSWFALVVHFYSLLTFSLLLFFLILDLTSSSVIIGIGGEWGLRSFWIYFVADESIEGAGGVEDEQRLVASSAHFSAAGLATFVKLAQIDALMLLVFQLLQCAVTYTAPRVKHVLLSVVAIKSLQVLRFDTPLLTVLSPLLAAVRLPAFNLMGLFDTREHRANDPLDLADKGEMNPSSFALYYLTVRTLLLVGQTLYAIFFTRTSPHPSHTVLPGRALELDKVVLADLQPRVGLTPDTRDRMDRALANKIEGLESLATLTPHGVDRPPPPPSSRDAPLLSSLKNPSFSKRIGMSLWYASRLVMFWSVVFLLKVVFDTFVLLPSVAGISITSLCHTPFEHGRNIANPWIASTVATPLKTREELVLENVRPDNNTLGSTEHGLNALFIAQVACPTLVYVLWSITAVVSLASTYVSYILTVSLFGAIVPGFFDSTTRANRVLLAGWMVLLWISTVLAIIVGSFAACLGLLLLLALVNLLISTTGAMSTCRATGSNSAGIEAIRRALEQEGEQARREYDDATAEQHSKEAPPKDDAASSSSSSTGSVSFHSPLVYGLQRALQVLYHDHLTLDQTLLTWRTIVQCMREEDLISRREMETVLAIRSPSANDNDDHDDDFLSALAPLRSAQVRERINFFFDSLAHLSHKSSSQTASAGGGAARFPFSVARQKSHTVLIPLFTETVFYTLDELRQPNTNAAGAAISNSHAAATAITLLEFLVAKHADEWNNFVERMCETHRDLEVHLRRVKTRGGAEDPPLDDDDSAAPTPLDSVLMPLAACALDELLVVDTSARVSEALDTLIREVLLWTSYRGQTLSRTVRGLLYTRRALGIIARYELERQLGDNVDLLDESRLDHFLASKFQLLIAAQVYGARTAGRTNRYQMKQLMALHAPPTVVRASDSSSSSSSSSSASCDTSSPLLELVYNYDVRRDLEECVELRRKMLRPLVHAAAIGQRTTAVGPRHLIQELREPLAPYHFPPRLSNETATHAPAPAGAVTHMHAAITSLQERLLRAAHQVATLRSLAPAVATANAASAAAAVADLAAVLDLFSPDANEDNLQKPSEYSSHPSLLAPSAPSLAHSMLTSEEELLIHCATQHCWLEMVQFVRFEVAAIAQAHVHTFAVHGLFTTFLHATEVYLSHDDDMLEVISSSPSLDAAEAIRDLHEAVDNLATTLEAPSRVSANHALDEHALEEEVDAKGGVISSAIQDLHRLLRTHHQAQVRVHLAFLERLTSRTDKTASHSSSSSSISCSSPPDCGPSHVPPVAAVNKSVSKQVHSAVGALYHAHERLLVHPFYSCHIESVSTGVRLVRALPRHRNLLLGSIPRLPHLPCPQTQAKSENQLHATIFARGEAITTNDMNQDLTLEDALKVPWLLTEFQPHPLTDESRFTLVGASERIYTADISTVGRFMAMQDTSFVTIVQRVLNYTEGRLHYGHPDVMLAEHVKYRGCGLSKASPEKNLSEDLFFGTDNLLRGNSTSHAEYLRYGKGREVSLTTTAIFEDKLARGAAQMLRTSDLWRLSQHLDALTSLSVFFGSILHYLYTLVFDYTITSFVWIVLLMRLAHVDSERIGVLGSVYAIPWLFHLGYLFGLPLLAQLLLRHGAWGVVQFANNLLLGSVYYLFQLRTKATGMQSGFHAGSAKYKGTGRSFGLAPDTLLTLYQQYARSHYHHALQLLSLLFLYATLLTDEPLHVIGLKCYAVLLACLSWLLAPALFNPSFLYARRRDSSAPDRVRRVVASKKGELRQAWQWVHRPFSTDLHQASWEQWMWEGRFHVLQMRATRAFMIGGGGGGRVRHLMQHPYLVSAWELLMRLIEWSPWLFLAVALFLASIDLVPTFLVYALLLTVLYASPVPRSIRLAFLCTCMLLYFTSVQIMDATDDVMMRHRTHHPFFLSLASLPDMFSLALAFFLVHVIMCDLVLCGYVEAAVTREMMRDYRSRAAAHEDATVHTAYSARTRPVGFAFISNHPLCCSWQLVYRYAAPITISLVHFAVSVATHVFSRAHTRACYGVDMEDIAAQHARRQQQQQPSQSRSQSPHQHLPETLHSGAAASSSSAVASPAPAAATSSLSSSSSSPSIS